MAKQLISTGAVDPTGAVTPTFEGQIYIDTTADNAYMSTGLTSSDWKDIGAAGGAGSNSFETVNCPAGTNPVASSATDTLALTSAGANLTITGDSGTDTIDLAVVDSAIDHDALTNFASDEHVAHASVSMTTGATSGLSGGGTIASTRTLLVDPSLATAGTVASLDELLIADVDDSDNLKKVTAQSIADLGGGGSDFSGQDPTTNYVQFEDWIESAGDGAVAPINTGTGAATIFATDLAAVDANHPGQIISDTGTTATGSSRFFLNRHYLGGAMIFEVCIYLPALSTGSEEYSIWAGLNSSHPTTTTTAEYRIGFQYDRAINGVNWHMATSNGSAETETDSGTAMTADWVRLRFEVNQALTSVEYFIDGASVGTVTATIPNSGTDLMYPIMGIKKSVGTTEAVMRTDYIGTNYTVSR